MPKLKMTLICILTAGISLFAASYRFGDSAHAIGMLNIKGGKVRHPFQLKSGQERYTLIMTGVVLPPVQGELRVALEGQPAMSYVLYNSEPLVKLGIHRQPDFDKNLLSGVQSGDRLGLWVVMHPQSYDYLFTETSAEDPAEMSSEAGLEKEAPLSLNFYAAASGKKLLGIPVVFTDLEPEGGSHGAHH